ncbi:hypothetical protein [Paraurantiacibacter namhicola]|uniref:Uncharacterized protein n=1 Tax=Paraurantiacibacter namhicola TaxID=645517 RepID=A0A1C7D5D5_9SPHN|nr:hypothetical protein [Paraurantiacibacter namhicola]ANU06513.1 hypothetical protein A6F65_00186 [Paraurantiacibacter namhicola]
MTKFAQHSAAALAAIVLAFGTIVPLTSVPAAQPVMASAAAPAIA